MVNSIVGQIPDFQISHAEVERWLQEVVSVALTLSPSDASNWVSIDGATVFGSSKHCLGGYGQGSWRRFVVGLLAEDWASYTTPVDRVDFERLAYVASIFPTGFRLFLADTKGHGFIPVGYSAWHPMAVGCFRLLKNDATSLVDRTVIPLRNCAPGSSDIYLFNYSVASQLRGTALSKALTREYARDVWATNPRSLSAITVSTDGGRVAEKFGATRRMPIVVDGQTEDVYIWERS